MSLFPDSGSDLDRPAESADHDSADRVDSLVAWVSEIDSRLRVAEVATGDEKTAKELRKAVEAAAKHDPKLGERLGDRIDVLADRLATLATTVSTTAAALARKDGELAALRRELEADKTRVDAALGQPRGSTGGAEIDELRNAISAISAAIDQKLPRRMEGRIDDLKASVVNLAQRLETLSSTVSTTASTLAGREGEVAALKRSLDAERAGIEVEIAKLRAAVDPAPVDELRTTVKTLSDGARALERDGQRRHDAVKSALDSIGQRVDALTVAVATATRDLASGEGEVAALRSAFDEESTRVDSLLVKLHQATGELSARVAELGGLAASDTVDELGEHLAELSARVDTLGTAVKDTAAGYADKEYEIAALGRRFEEINAQVDEGVRELRDAVGRMAEQGRDPELEKRVDGLAGEVGAFGQRLATIDREASKGRDEVSAAVSALEQRLAALGQQLDRDHGEAALAASQLARAVQATEAWAQERASFEATSNALERRVAELGHRLEAAESADVQDARVDVLAGEIGALTERVADLGRQLDRDHGEAALAASQLARAVQATEAWAQERASFEATSNALERKVAELGHRLEAAESADVQDARVDVLAGEIGALTERVADLGRQLDQDHGEAALAASQLARAVQATEAWAQERASFEATSNALERKVAELGHRLEAAESADVQDARVDRLVVEVGELAERLTAVDATTATGRDEAAAAAASVEQRLAELGSALGGSASSIESLQAAVESSAERSAEREAELRALSDRFHDASARVDALVGELRTALETMPAPVSADAVEQRLDELGARVGDVEQSRATAALEIARASASWSDERTAIRDQVARFEQAAAGMVEEHAAAQRRLETLAEAVAALESREQAPEGAGGEHVQEIVEKVEQLDREREALAAEIAGATAFWSSGLGALEAQLAEVASAKDEGARKVDDEVVRALFDLARRLDAVERGHAAGDAEVARATESWSAEREFLAAGLDELTRRLDALDSGDGSGASTASPLGEPNDGRFRLELRALELRMEHAEAAARENREAVLVQLERLATRIEWRLQRLETGNVDDPLPQVANGPLAQVVPLHGSEA